VTGPEERAARGIDAILAAAARWWPLAMARELDDAILMLRTNELEIGTLLLKTRGPVAGVLAADAEMQANQTHWFVRETMGFVRRSLARLDVSSRSLFAIIDQGSCFAGTLLELAFAADRSYMLALPDERDAEPAIALSAQNYGAYPMCNGRTRLANRFAVDTLAPEPEGVGTMLHSDAAREAGLVTFTPDDIDWDDEIRLALEERASLSPDALSGMEASLRFSGPETMHARIFGRLAAWQNWVFQRPNAVGEAGALKAFGTGSRAKFNWERV
jgi:benzoyl-CoA-dihydrodiol lyase